MADTKLLAVAGTDSATRLADVVFVHGLDGDPQLSWQFEDDEESFWPRLLFNDLPQLGIWSFGYDAGSSKWLGNAMPIVDRATNFAAFLRSEGIGDRPLFFVAHSLGGLVVKQMLRSRYDQDHSDPFVANTQAIFFFGTPHSGSPIANYMKWLGLYRPSTLINELEFSNAALRDLNAWYRASAARLGIDSIVFAETQKVKNVVLVVDQVSSDPGLPGVVPIPIDCDHVEICKVDIDSLAYKTVRNRIQEFTRNVANRVSIKETGDLWADVSCFNKYPEQWEEKSVPKDTSQILQYSVVREADRIRIEPELPYLASVRKQEPVWSLAYMWMPFRWLPVTLDIKLLNRGSTPLYLTQLELLVEHSNPDKEPVLFVKRGDGFPYIYIQNEGWGVVEDASLKLAFADAVGEPNFPDDLPFEISIAGFEEGVEVDLSSLFAKQGVDVDAVMNHDPTAVLGPFTSGVAFVYGELTTNISGIGVRKLRFGTDVRISGPICGMYGPPTFEYTAKLKIEGDNYIVPLEISQIIAPGDSDRLLVQLDADKSSRHRLRLRFKGSGPDFPIDMPIEISMFVPRSVAEHLSEPENDHPQF
jgi:hypothetical protein